MTDDVLRIFARALRANWNLPTWEAQASAALAAERAARERMEAALDTMRGTLKWVEETATIYCEQVGDAPLVSNISTGLRTIASNARAALERGGERGDG